MVSISNQSIPLSDPLVFSLTTTYKFKGSNFAWGSGIFSTVFSSNKKFKKLVSEFKPDAIFVDRNS